MPFRSLIPAFAGAASVFSLLLPARAEIPAFTRIAFMGDSITGQTGAPDGTRFYRYGLWSNLASHLGQQVEIVRNGASTHFSASGMGSVYIRDVHLSRILASGAEACFVLAGTNDGGSRESVAEVLREICTTLADHGITPVLCDILPIRSGLPERSAWLVAMKENIREICEEDPRIIHCDWFNVLDGNDDGVIDQNHWYFDQVHPDADAMSRLGAYAATVIAPHIRPKDVYANTAWITPNPAMEGTGSSPQGWFADPPPGNAIEQSLVPREDGLGYWWQIRITGTATHSNTYLRYEWGAPGENWQPGDAVELISEFEMDQDATPVSGYRPILFIQPSGITLSDGDLDINYTSDLQYTGAGIMRTPAAIIPAGTNNFFLYLQITGTGTWRIGRTGARRVPLSFSTWITSFPGLADLSADADPDGDGASSRMEWVYGTDPSVADASRFPVLSRTSSGASWSFPYSERAKQDVSLTLQHSADLTSWSDLPVAGPAEDSQVRLQPDPENPFRWTASTLQPAPPAAMFFRLKPAWKPAE